MPSASYNLKILGIRPNKRLGQNFLVDKNALEKLVGAAEITKNDVVLEVGAGTGIITAELAKLARKVIAVEKDLRLVSTLKEAISGLDNVEIVAGDILKLPVAEGRGQWILLGNIPYYLTAPLIRRFLEAEDKPKLIVLMVQKEVAQRICAKPPDMSILAVSVQVYAKPEIISYVSRSSFWPQPRVDSAIVKIKPYESCQLSMVNCQLFFKIVKAGFSSPRKQLINNLAKGFDVRRAKAEEWLIACGIAPERRAETLGVEDWVKLASIPK